MSDSFWKKLNIIAGLLALTALFGLLVFAANIEIKDLDLWLHLGMGRTILQLGYVPQVDILSCTVAGTPWINHEWLFQLVVYAIYTMAGFDGLITMQVVLVAMTMSILLFLGYNRNKQMACLFALLLVSLVYQSRFTTRPDLFSLLFFALYILFLSFYLDRRWAIYALVAVQVLWTNMHGFFFFGPLFVAIALAAEWCKRHVRLPYSWNRVARLNNDEYRRLKLIFLAVIVACLVNPMTFKGAWYPVKIFFQISGDSSIFFGKITELKRPITAATFTSWQYPYYRLLILISFISLYFNRRKLDIGVFAFWLVFLLFSLSAIRNMIYFAFAAYLVFVTNALNLSYRDILPFTINDRKFIDILGILAKVFLIFWMLQYTIEISGHGYWDYARYERKSEFGGVSQRNFPDRAVDFLVENGVRGCFFNDFNSGAYFVGRAYPDIKVFIDGRTEVYGPEFFRKYLKIWDDQDTDILQTMIEKHGLTGAFLNSVRSEVPPKLAKWFQEDPDWMPVYLGYDGMVYLKDVPLNRRVIEEHALDFESWDPPRFDVLRLGSAQVVPYYYVNRAYSLMAVGFDDAALREVALAKATNPGYREPYKIAGKIFAKRKDFRKAFENFRIAVMLDINDKQGRYNLALAYFDLGEYLYAARQYQKIIDLWPGQVQAYFLKSRSLIKAGRYQEAIRTLEAALALEPGNTADVLKLGELMQKEGRPELGLMIYDMVKDPKKAGADVFLKKGLAYKEMGREKQMQEAFMRALAAEPDNEEVLNQLNRVGRP